jgi:hypothetical protein
MVCGRVACCFAYAAWWLQKHPYHDAVACIRDVGRWFERGGPLSVGQPRQQHTVSVRRNTDGAARVRGGGAVPWCVSGAVRPAPRTCAASPPGGRSGRGERGRAPYPQLGHVFDFLAKSTRRTPPRTPLRFAGPGVTTAAMTDALDRDARALLAAYDEGSWRPADGEFTLAGDLARAHWNGSAFRTALREVPPSVRSGRLADVLDPAAAVLELTDASIARDALLALRQLIDALAAD